MFIYSVLYDMLYILYVVYTLCCILCCIYSVSTQYINMITTVLYTVVLPEGAVSIISQICAERVEQCIHRYLLRFIFCQNKPQLYLQPQNLRGMNNFAWVTLTCWFPSILLTIPLTLSGATFEKDR